MKLFIFYSTVAFPQVQCCKTIITLLLFLWQMFRWAPPFSFARSELSRNNPKFYVCRVESPTFTLHSICKTEVPLREAPSQELILCETDSCIDISLNTTILTFSRVNHYLSSFTPFYIHLPTLIFSNCLSRETLRPCNGLNLVLKRNRYKCFVHLYTIDIFSILEN